MPLYLNSPYGICNDGERCYISDTGNHRIQVTDLYGNFLYSWGEYGTGPGQFSSPKGIAANGRYVFVVDQGNNRFQIFTALGAFIMAHGEYGLGESPDVLNAPTNCYVDEYYLWIDDTGNGYVKYYELNFIGDYGAVVLPAVTVNAHGGWPSGRGNIILPAVTVNANGDVIRSGYGAVKLPAVTVSGSGYAWHIGVGNVILPVTTVDARGGVYYIGRGNIVLPAVTVSGSGYAWHIGTGNVVLPAVILSANGYVVLANPEFFGIAMNMRNKAISTYSGYAFNSMAVDKDGHVCGANENGIYLLEGAKDNGVNIDAHVKTGVFDLHDPRVQRLVDAWLTLRTSGSGVFTVYEDEETDGSSEEVIVEETTMHDERVGLPQGLKGRFAAFEFENSDGADFDLEGISVKTRVLNRTR